jgi:hypothetical protein
MSRQLKTLNAAISSTIVALRGVEETARATLPERDGTAARASNERQHWEGLRDKVEAYLARQELSEIGDTSSEPSGQQVGGGRIKDQAPSSQENQQSNKQAGQSNLSQGEKCDLQMCDEHGRTLPETLQAAGIDAASPNQGDAGGGRGGRSNRGGDMPIDSSGATQLNQDGSPDLRTVKGPDRRAGEKPTEMVGNR